MIVPRLMLRLGCSLARRRRLAIAAGGLGLLGGRRCGLLERLGDVEVRKREIESADQGEDLGDALALVARSP
jgi:hypothetical protein